ncbi:DNA-binding response regulator [Elizabethkingia miricola]|uniref:LytTR family DNA-binding domain-containing protein n=1 Tax=Elizabethkingia miricola TaxID=172045 RepID=A0AAQ3EAG8_ELIMR|nr:MULTISPECIES: LytTR family DNA-binding domain-containing protein [Elizabethkingia]KUG11525.1 LytTR family transcriptional regulator [Elizabethkingia miricola]MCL1657618.1 LytTR family DNA-binding domain-containing protein [Elizabethkingia miricola]MCP1250293.1 LytTR family DNA-binding domain-containing protein [Elizabethkingia sp. S0634]MDQ8749341.1 LytTR family DNA-binding domain-containing protein [Elizabethkingia miricola]MDX8570904.1 LytTR family DNA-binding domain-containing protein [E
MIKTLIIEDEKPAARRLERMLSTFPELEIQKVIHSVEDGVQWLSENEHPKLIFSDIVLGDGLSFDIFEKIPTKSFIIYTTAFDQYTLKAFKLNSIDYLLKPIDEEDLTKAIDKFKSFIPSGEVTPSYEVKSMLGKEKTTLSRILVKIGYNLKIVMTSEVSCFYSENKIVYLQTAERSFPTDFSLEELENVLDETQFFRVNRQFMINLNYIKSIHTSPVYKVEMNYQPDVEITVSRDRVKDFKDWLVR